MAFRWNKRTFRRGYRGVPLTEPAFEAQVRPHLDALYRTALRLSRDRAGADDIVQEAVIKAWRHYDRFEQGTNFRGWIFKILMRTFLNEHRRKRRAPAVSDFAEVEPEGAPETNWLTVEDLSRLGDRVGDAAKAALDKLPDEHRMIFYLSTYEELSYREIAVVMEIPIGTVMSRLFRAREALRHDLADYAREGGWLKERQDP